MPGPRSDRLLGSCCRGRICLACCVDISRFFAGLLCNFQISRFGLRFWRRSGSSRRGCRGNGRGLPGRLVMELLNALLELVDAVSAAIGIAAVWYGWVAMPHRNALPRPRRPSAPDELDQFLHAATMGKTSGDSVA